MLNSILGRARAHRPSATSLIYGIIAVVALGLAYLVRFEFDVQEVLTTHFLVLAGLLIVIRVAVNYFFRLGFGHWRFVGMQDFLRLLAAETVGSAVFLTVSWSLPVFANAPRSVVLLEWVFNGYLTGGAWIAYRIVYERLRVRQAERLSRVIVVGAGEGGQLLVRQMLRSKTGLYPVGFVDDDPFKWGTLIHGVEVVGGIADVAAIAETLRADEIVIAIPSASSEQLRSVVEACEVAGLPLKILPGIEDVLSGNAALNYVREVRIEDLLGRDPIHLELPALATELSDKTVLVTGAAGSIGSELVRQLALHTPRSLVLFDQAETPLYYLELELRKSFPDLLLSVVVGSVTHSDTVAGVLRAYRPDRVFHAAAYKHVPMMEGNRWEAVRTNVLGTYNVGKAAGESGAEAFLLISTDKAVRPSNVMGATKQLAERVCLHLQNEYPACAFQVVRFGNVLGSNGSVIPLFRQQLERGEPLTVTHEDVTRYFMTIAEAVQLVLQASLLPESRGRVAMLDMGKPVRILNLARDLLRLSGQPFRPGENVVISGLRPGEKMHEELAAPHERVLPTSVERVSIVETSAGFAQLPFEIADSLEAGDLDALVDWIFTESPGLSMPVPATASPVRV